MGMDAMFYTRIDYLHKDELIAKKDTEQVWRPDEANFGAKKDVLSVLNAFMQKDHTDNLYCFNNAFATD